MNKTALRQLELRPTTFFIADFPVPPSVNKLYGWSRQYNKLVKSREYRGYEGKVQKWVADNPDQIKNVRIFIKDIGIQVLHVDAKFVMNRSDIVCKNGKVKCNDTANRLKALHDVLASVVLGIDDMLFWSGSFEKIAVDGKSSACVNVTLKLRNI